MTEQAESDFAKVAEPVGKWLGFGLGWLLIGAFLFGVFFAFSPLTTGRYDWKQPLWCASLFSTVLVIRTVYKMTQKDKGEPATTPAAQTREDDAP